MTPLERLLAEALPTGTFGHAQPIRRRTSDPEPGPRWTPEEQAAHLAELLAELDRYETRGPRRPDLRVIDGEAA